MIEYGNPLNFFLKKLPGTIFLLLATFPGYATDSSGLNIPKPNIVLFLVDDMGVMDTSVPFLVDDNDNPVVHPLNNFYRTPTMEQLANQGLRFSKFYTNSVCSPSRVSLMTGQYSARHNTTQFIRSEGKFTDNADPPDWNWAGLNRNSVTLPRLLQTIGYRTIHVGKGHLGGGSHEGEDPENIGFDINISGSSHGMPGSYYGKDDFGAANPNQRSRAVPDLQDYHGTDTFLTDALTREMNIAVSAAVKDDKPFFAYMSHFAVHFPFQPHLRFIRNYMSSGKPPLAKAYASLIEGVDDSLNQILRKLAQLGEAENTLILFLGDNGSDAPLGNPFGYSSSAPLRGKKGTHYEGGVRVPFIVSWAKPSASSALQKTFPIVPGIAHDQFATILDLFPTILDLVNVAIPKGHIYDGQSLRAVFAGKKQNHTQRFLMHYPHQSIGGSNYFTSYYSKNWKLVFHYIKPGIERFELFDLENDPYEKENLAETQTGKLKEMLSAMKTELNDADAQYPVDRKINASITVQ